MFATGKTPTLRTDSTFMEGQWSQFSENPRLGNAYKRVAKKHGVDVKGKVYLSQLANFPGDPRAWVSSRGEVQKLCEERGWGCSGAVNVKAQSLDVEPREVGLDEEIVNDRVAGILEAVPEADRPHVDTEDLKDQVRSRHKPHWSK